MPIIALATSSVGGGTAYVGFTGGTGGLTSVQDVQSWTYNNGTATVIDHSGGFGSNGDLTANGSATFANNSAQLTDGGFSEAGSIFTNARVNVAKFTTTFTFDMRQGTNPMADGITFTIQNGTSGPDYAMSVEKVSPKPGSDGQLPVLDSFTPHDELSLSNVDLDQGSGGVMLLPDQTSGPAHLLVQTGKTGRVYLINRDDMGGFSSSSDNVVQVLPDNTVNGGSYGTPAYFNDGSRQLIYYMGSDDVLKSFTLSDGQLSTAPFAETTQTFGFPGATPSVSANGTRNGIVWVVDTSLNGTGGHPNSGPAVLHAYDATTLQELYNSSQLGLLDQLGNADKFMTPTIANGKVYVGTQTGLYVFGLLSAATSKPAAPTGLGLTVNGSSITLNWTNHATNARTINIYRSDGGAGNFLLIAQLNRAATTYTDTGLVPSTRYFYEVVASNAKGDSESNIASAVTPIAPAVLQVTGVGPALVALSWTPTADDHYGIQRSADGVHFTTVGNVAAGGGTTFSDGNLPLGVYAYRVEGFDVDRETAFSNTVEVTVGEAVVVSHAAGFATALDLTANGSATFTNGVARLTDGGGNEAGTVFATQKVDVRSFATTFTFQMSNAVADGLSFILQNDSPAALGFSGGGLGYQTIRNSVAVKFDLFDNAGEGSDSTGLFFNGDSPTVAQAPGESSIDLSSTGINLHSGDPFKVFLTYDGSTLSETITDLTTNASFGTTYEVDIPALVGSAVAYAGFGAGTDSLTTTADVLKWTYHPTTQDLVPAAPSGLKVTDVRSHDAHTSDIQLAWTINAYNQPRISVQRSADGLNFTTIATLDPNAMAYTDSKLAAGTYYYRLLSVGPSGVSLSDVSSVIVGTPGQAVMVDHSAGFANSGDLTATGSAGFAGTVARLTDGGFAEAGGVFTTSRVAVATFTTAFTFRLHDGTTPMADGMAFVIQGNGPADLGSAGGGLGYGTDLFGAARQGAANGLAILNSIAIKFDLYNNTGEGIDSTGLFVNGDPPLTPSGPGDVLVDLSSTGIDLHSQDAFKVTLAYDGVTLTETIADTSTGDTFTTSYKVNIPALVGGSVACVGFTGATGGLSTIADVESWQYRFTSPAARQGIPARLVFLSQPGQAPVNGWLAPFQVLAVDQFGNRLNGVVVNLVLIPVATTGPAGFSPGSVVQATAVNGVATFSHFAINACGRYQLDAFDFPGVFALSNPFDVDPRGRGFG
ncbi:MAG TPA: hypothetical protein VKA46_33695 [Gemmataceae bacterium]|nr:hypothetical protein [Gemmataceae bacterium]